MPIRRIAFVAFLLAATLCVSFAQTQADDPGNSLLAFLNQPIDWYHRIQIPSQLSHNPSDSIYTSSLVLACMPAFTFADNCFGTTIWNTF
jgi:hypothetical protein